MRRRPVSGGLVGIVLEMMSLLVSQDVLPVWGDVNAAAFVLQRQDLDLSGGARDDLRRGPRGCSDSIINAIPTDMAGVYLTLRLPLNAGQSERCAAPL